MSDDAPPAGPSLWPDPNELGTVTDLYQLTMMAGYHAEGRHEERATFELFARRRPPNRSYLVLAGLEQALDDLLGLRFSDEEVTWLRALPVFAGIASSFFDYLRTVRFEGEVWAVREGTVVFAGEPLVRVTGPLAQAQWVETFLLAALSYPTLVASKAARVVRSAAGRPVFDFGLRRGHGHHAGMLAARASYVAGCAGTSNVEAARRLGVPCSGTMAHSWVQSFDTEPAAFEAFARSFPGATTLLVDTYDTAEGVRHAAALDPPVRALRIDSGDLLREGLDARAALDALGRPGVELIASGDLDEWGIARLVAAGAPYDAFGVGTELVTSRDAPALSMVYKLVELGGRGRAKRSPGKASLPFAKQVRRFRDLEGRLLGDVVTLHDEPSEGSALLLPHVERGMLVRSHPSLSSVREFCRAELESLPAPFLDLDSAPSDPVSHSDRLRDAARLL